MFRNEVCSCATCTILRSANETIVVALGLSYATRTILRSESDTIIVALRVRKRCDLSCSVLLVLNIESRIRVSLIKRNQPTRLTHPEWYKIETNRNSPKVGVASQTTEMKHAFSGCFNKWWLFFVVFLIVFDEIARMILHLHIVGSGNDLNRGSWVCILDEGLVANICCANKL